MVTYKNWIELLFGGKTLANYKLYFDEMTLECNVLMDRVTYKDG